MWAVTVGGRQAAATGTVSTGAGDGFEPSAALVDSGVRPEPADLLRLARRGLRAVVQAARVEPEVSVAAVLGAHLGPDAAGRRRLLEVYRRNLDLQCDLTPVVERTEGVTASFLKELLRRAALAAAEGGSAASGDPAAAVPIVVEDQHLLAALEELLDDRHQLTRLTIGGGRRDEGTARRPAD